VFWVILGVSFILLIFPNIIGWNTADVWIMGIPESQFCLYLFPLLIVLSMGGMYLVDYDYEKKKAEAARKEEAEKGGEK
jgi:hypothetical protein